MDFLNGLSAFLGSLGHWALDNLKTILGWARGLISKLGQFFGFFKSLLGSVLSHLGSIWHAITRLRLSTVWSTLKKLYGRFMRWLNWWNKRVMGPLDRMRRQLDLLYKTFFAPIIRFLDALRAPLKILALFNRKLAARLDGFLFGLESKIMAPLLALYQRVNLLSSWFRGIITTLGYLDRAMLVESCRRDALKIWQVLTNPREVIYSPPSATPPRTISDLDQDFKVYVSTGGGPLDDQLVLMDEYFLQVKAEIA
jgi:hypothetical protein